MKKFQLRLSAFRFPFSFVAPFAIHAAGWVSLFTLHVLWPFLWIWAMAYRPERGWGFSEKDAAPPIGASEIEDLRRRITELEKIDRRISELEKARTSIGG